MTTVFKVCWTTMMCARKTGQIGDDYLAIEDAVLMSTCEVDCYRASGPGGQKRNKTSSAVRIRHLPTGLMGISSEDRSQHVNRRRALRRLRLTIALQVRRPVDIVDFNPTDLLRSCVTSRKELSVGQRDERYCAAVQQILDVLVACELRLRSAADVIGISTSQLSKFVCKDQKLLARTNELRKAIGLSPLR